MKMTTLMSFMAACLILFCTSQVNAKDVLLIGQDILGAAGDIQTKITDTLLIDGNVAYFNGGAAELLAYGTAVEIRRK